MDAGAAPAPPVGPPRHHLSPPALHRLLVAVPGVAIDWWSAGPSSSCPCASVKKTNRDVPPQIHHVKAAGGWIPRGEVQSSRAAGSQNKGNHWIPSLSIGRFIDFPSGLFVPQSRSCIRIMLLLDEKLVMDDCSIVRIMSFFHCLDTRLVVQDKKILLIVSTCIK